MKNYYEILGVSQNAELEVIKGAYKALSRKYHPDVDLSSAERFKAINEAYETLVDSSERAKYDALYHSNQAAKNAVHTRSSTVQYSNQTFEQQTISEYERKKQFRMKPRGVAGEEMDMGLIKHYMRGRNTLTVLLFCGPGLSGLFWFFPISGFPLQLDRYIFPVIFLTILFVPKFRKLAFAKQLFLEREIAGDLTCQTYDEQMADLKKYKKMKRQQAIIIKKHKQTKQHL